MDFHTPVFVRVHGRHQVHLSDVQSLDIFANAGCDLGYLNAHNLSCLLLLRAESFKTVARLQANYIRSQSWSCIRSDAPGVCDDLAIRKL